jgi:hypothetical protein
VRCRVGVIFLVLGDGMRTPVYADVAADERPGVGRSFGGGRKGAGQRQVAQVSFGVWVWVRLLAEGRRSAGKTDLQQWGRRWP